jgi:ribonucleoside-diphosphate reductase alpha chain
VSLEQDKEAGNVPEWVNDESYSTLTRGYLFPDETVRDAVERMSGHASSILNKPELKSSFFTVLWNGWLIPASPIWSNLGRDRGLTISCNKIQPADSVNSLFKKNHELAMLSKHGAGVGIYLGDIRGRNSDIKNNGVSDGIIPWIKCFETTTMAVSQGGVRKGASSVNIPITHPDYEEFLLLRRSTGDHNLRARNINLGSIITDDFMHSLSEGNEHNRKLWTDTLKERVENGEPYITYIDTVNKMAPPNYKNLGLSVKSLNICQEICIHTDEYHTAVCCLSSLNVAKYEDWKNWKCPTTGLTLPQLAVYFLEAILDDYIKKASLIDGFECAVRSASKGRDIGIGALGWHTLLQSKSIPFDSYDCFMLNAEVFSFIQREATEASKKLAIERGEPEFAKGTGVRHCNLTAIAPNASSSLIAGGLSPSIEPINANAFSVKSAKGVFIRKNLELEKLLELKGKNTVETWSQIVKDNGSVKNLKFLSPEEREVFLTAREINQHVLIKLASQRQKFVSQSQSLNLFFNSNASAKYIHEVHYEAWKQGVKSLYYLRSETVLGASETDSYRSAEECISCHG